MKAILWIKYEMQEALEQIDLTITFQVFTVTIMHKHFSSVQTR